MNRILSEKEIRKKSQMEVFYATDEVKEFVLSREFTVEKGEWGNYYGSRAEVWFQPDDLNQPKKNWLPHTTSFRGW